MLYCTGFTARCFGDDAKELSRVASGQDGRQVGSFVDFEGLRWGMCVCVRACVCVCVLCVACAHVRLS